jgi:hypothetical protein
MATDDVSEVIVQRLFRIFRVQDEEYTVTVKLVYIYRWIEPYAGNSSFDVITDLRKLFTDDSNLQTIDKLYSTLKIITLNTCGRYDTSTTNVPMHKNLYEQGWRP